MRAFILVDVLLVSFMINFKCLHLNEFVLGTNQGQNLGQSVFDYIEKQHSRSPLFYNFMFSTDTDNPVLRPCAQLPNLEIWGYYLGEELAHGPSYDLEVLQMDLQQDEESEAADGSSVSARCTVIAG